MTTSTKPMEVQVVWNGPSADRIAGDSMNAEVHSHWSATKWGHLVLYLLAPALVVAILSGCIRQFDLDLRASRYFFDTETRQFHSWGEPIWLLLFKLGPLPGLALGVGATAVLAASYVWRGLIPYRRASAFLAMLLVLSPGLLVNGILKPMWDRPRPCELREFGGSEAFVPVLDLRIIGEQASKSFPSGHASIGFYLLAPFFVLARRRRGWAMTFLLLGLLLGTVMGVGRVAQGRHFPSDVVWSGAIVYFSGLLLAYFVLPAKRAWQTIDTTARDAADPRSIFRLDAYRERSDQQDDAAKRRAA